VAVVRNPTYICRYVLIKLSFYPCLAPRYEELRGKASYILNVDSRWNWAASFTFRPFILL